MYLTLVSFKILQFNKAVLRLLHRLGAAWVVCLVLGQVSVTRAGHVSIHPRRIKVTADISYTVPSYTIAGLDTWF